MRHLAYLAVMIAVIACDSGSDVAGGSGGAAASGGTGGLGTAGTGGLGTAGTGGLGAAGTGGLGAAGTGGRGGSGACDLPPSQAMSAPCCLEHGLDACGAGLFCAAFDGRTIPTCYAERSRDDQASCSADVQCRSGSCNLDAGLCRSSPHTTCSVEIGCAPDAAGARSFCLDGSCEVVGGGGLRQRCHDDGDCTEDGLLCDLTDHLCRGDLYRQCSDHDDCAGTIECNPAHFCTPPCGGESNAACPDGWSCAYPSCFEHCDGATGAVCPEGTYCSSSTNGFCLPEE